MVCCGTWEGSGACSPSLARCPPRSALRCAHVHMLAECPPQEQCDILVVGYRGHVAKR